jgi:hypothetical protein
MLNELLKVHEAFRLERRRHNGTGVAAPDHQEIGSRRRAPRREKGDGNKQSNGVARPASSSSTRMEEDLACD